MKDIKFLDNAQENVDTNRSGTVANSKVTESFDCNVMINLGGESNVNLQDNKESDAVQISDPNPDTISIEKEITLENNNENNDLKMNETNNNNTELNNSILSVSDTNKSKKKVTFQK